MTRTYVPKTIKMRYTKTWFYTDENHTYIACIHLCTFNIIVAYNYTYSYSLEYTRR